jgi:FHA domain
MPTCPAGHESAADDYCDECGRRIGGAPEPASPGGTADTGGPAGTGTAAGAPGAAAGAPGAAAGWVRAAAGGTVGARTAGGGPGTASARTAGGGPGTAGARPAGGEPASGGPTEAGPRAEPCPQCGTPRSGRFCEVCRFDFATGVPANSAPLSGPAASGPATGATLAPPVPSSAPVHPDGQAWSAVVTADHDYFDRVVATGGPEAAAISFPPYCPERRFSLGTSRTGEQRQIGRHSVSRGIAPDIDLTGPPTDPGISRLHAVLIGQSDGGWAVLDPGSENGTLVNDQEIATGVQVPLHDGDRIHLGAWTAITIRRG